MEVLTVITTVVVLIHSLLKIGKLLEFEPKLKQFPEPSNLIDTSHMREVTLKGLDYSSPVRYFVQGQTDNKVWLLAQSRGHQSSLVVNSDAIRSK